MTEQPLDEEIVSKASRGDRHSLDVLVERHYRAVWKAIMRFTGDQNETDTLTQEAFLRAIRSLRAFRGEAQLRTWIIRIGLNQALNGYRRKKPAALPPEVVETRNPGPMECARQAEIREAVGVAIKALPAEYREALLLTFFGDCSHAEAARLLGCAEGTISWRVFTAREKLREMLPHGL